MSWFSLRDETAIQTYSDYTAYGQNSFTRNGLLRQHLNIGGIEVPVSMFQTDYMIWEYLFSTWIGWQSPDITSCLYIYLSCLWSIKFWFIFWRSQVHSDQDSRKRNPVGSLYFTTFSFSTEVDPSHSPFFQMTHYSYLYDQKIT